MPGIVYVLSNPAMPNLVKIEKTAQDDPKVRIDQLYSAGVPFPFECEIAVRVEDAAACEQALHAAFAPQRVNPRREFFELDPEDIKPLLEILGDEDVTPGAAAAEEGEVDEASRGAADGYKRRRRPNINLEELGIPVGATLVLHQTGETAVVRGPQVVEFRGEEMSLTRAAKIGLGTDTTMASRYWRYKGRRLRDMHKELYE